MRACNWPDLNSLECLELPQKYCIRISWPNKSDFEQNITKICTENANSYRHQRKGSMNKILNLKNYMNNKYPALTVFGVQRIIRKFKVTQGQNLLLGFFKFYLIFRWAKKSRKINTSRNTFSFGSHRNCLCGCLSTECSHMYQRFNAE